MVLVVMLVTIGDLGVVAVDIAALAADRAGADGVGVDDRGIALLVGHREAVAGVDVVVEATEVAAVRR